jgi:hypothetical protein
MPAPPKKTRDRVLSLRLDEDMLDAIKAIARNGIAYNAEQEDPQDRDAVETISSVVYAALRRGLVEIAPEFFTDEDRPTRD